MAYTSLQDLFRFINPDEVKVYCGVGGNVREEAILPCIQTAQDLKIKKALGETLYNKLVVEFTTASFNPNNLADGTLNADGINYKELYFQMFKPLIWWTAYYSMNNIGVKVEEKGIMLNTSDYAENAEYNGLKLKEDRTRKTAEEYTEELYCYINDTFKDDEDFENESVDAGRRFSGIYFPNKSARKCNNCK